MAVTPEYTRKAIEKYNAKFERIQINAPKGTKDKIKSTGETVPGLINRLLVEYFEKLEEGSSDCPF